MNKRTYITLKKSKTASSIFGVILIFFLTSACHCDDEPEKFADNKVLLLRFNADANFTEGKEYKYFNETGKFTPVLSKQSTGNSNTVSISYKEINALLLKANSLPEPETGKIIIPEDFTDAENFERVATDDYIYPQNGFEELEKYHLTENELNNMWNQVQNLVTVRAYFKSRPLQKIYIYQHEPQLQQNTENSEWVLFVKN